LTPEPEKSTRSKGNDQKTTPKEREINTIRTTIYTHNSEFSQVSKERHILRVSLLKITAEKTTDGDTANLLLNVNCKSDNQ